MPNPRIAIVGAGPAGLTLARLLQQYDFACSIYESDPDRHARTQGGSLDLRPDSGQRAIRAAGLTEEFQRRSRPDGQALKLVKADDTVVLDENAEDCASREAQFDDRPEIDRHELRGMLLDSLRPGSIQWGLRVARIEAVEESAMYRIVVANGQHDGPFDLIVGADGAWSKVRPLVTSAQPFYSGVTCVDIAVQDVGRSHPWLSRYVGPGSCFMFDEGRAILCQRNGGDIIRVYACVRQPETWRNDCGVDWTDADAVSKMLEHEYFAGCGEDVRRLVREAKGETVSRPLYMMPVGHRWESRPGVTLIGDAAHVFTPFAGEGVNLAMTDAVELAERLAAKRAVFQAAKEAELSCLLTDVICDYEQDMFARATILATKTAHGLQHHFSKDGVVEMASRVTGRPPAEIQKELKIARRPLAVV